MCLCANYPDELRIVWISGGLDVLEKQKTVNGISVPVACDQRAHDYVPSFCVRGKMSSLSHTQKEFIVKYGWLDRSRYLFVKRMIDSPNVPCDDDQISATNEFKCAVYNFLANNAKYLQPSHELEMTLDIVLECLDLLKASPQERSNVAPT